MSNSQQYIIGLVIYPGMTTLDIVGPQAVFNTLPFHQTRKNCGASLQVTGKGPTLMRKNRPNCQLVYKKNNFSWGDFSGGWQIFRWY